MRLNPRASAWAGLLLALACASTAAAFDYARYVPATLADAEAPSCHPYERPSTHVDITMAPLRLAAVATSQSRPLSDTARYLLDMHKRMTGQELHAVFEQEVLVDIDGQPRWLPIQQQILAAWRDETADGRAVTLYAVRAGCHLPAEPAPAQVVFLINEFHVEPIGQPESHQ